VSALSEDAVARAFVAACRAELAALKPGNVHRFADGHGMTVAQFEASALAAAPAIAESGASVGARILGAVEATRAAVADNTNLGIILLCAPLAAAAQSPGGGLRERLGLVLAALDREDAARAFQAILLARPAGLGRSPRHDVRAVPECTLREAMAEAAGRDLIARQYAAGYAEVFEVGVARLRAARARWSDPDWPVVAVYLAFLAGFPDSHVARKHGPEAAHELCQRAEPIARRLWRLDEPDAIRYDLASLDRALKAEGLNPGTSADLTVASLFAAALEGLP
jgi:triphosphoribosyl-dephospho-CoA synthase